MRRPADGTIVLTLGAALAVLLGPLALRGDQAESARLAENRRHYDPITRTYAFNLKMDQPPPAGRVLELRVQLTDPAGNRLTTVKELQVAKPANP